MTPTQLPEDGIITIVPWPDALAEAHGHPAHGEYVEHFWLGILGPTATWLLRRCAGLVSDRPEGSVVDLNVLAHSLGLAYHHGRHNPFSRGFDRCIMFGLMRHMTVAPPVFAVRTSVPPLSLRHLARLPESLQTAHADYVALPVRATRLPA